MRILVWGINYEPELTGIAPYNAAMCEALAAAGHEVDMLTTFAYYPHWEKAKEDRFVLFRSECRNGVKVRRCWHYVPRRVTALKRIAHEFSFVALSFLRLMLLRRHDVVIAVSPPLLLGLAARVACWLRGRVPYVFHVQDLQPDAAVTLGMLKSGWLVRALFWLEAVAYAGATKVSGISAGMMKAFADKGVPESRRLYFPNGVRLPEEIPSRGQFRSHYQYADEDFLAIYSGNLGVKQGLEVLIEAARVLATVEPCIKVVICGGGARAEALRELVAEAALDNVRILPLQPDDLYRCMLMDADVSVICQQAGTGAAFFPSKLLSTLAYQRPVLSVADAGSELARATSTGGFGMVVSPGDATAVASALRELRDSLEETVEMSARAAEFVEQFEIIKVQGAFARELEALGGQPG